MITLQKFGPAMGLPDASPFCVKADVLMKMSGLSYERGHGALGKAPKGKLPFLDDDGKIVADSTFIRWHLEKSHGIDFDPGLSDSEKATAWAFEKLCEDNLYWATVHARWVDDANFDAGPRHFFAAAPAVVRPLVIAKVRRDVRRSLQGHGMGRHTRAEIEQLAIHGYAAISAKLGSKPFLMGDQPCGADATVFAWVGSILSPVFTSAIRTAVEGHANLVDYRDRGLARWYPEMLAA